MNDFYNESFHKVGLDEGGYANDPDDTGKETYLGFSRVHNPDLRMWDIIDEIKIGIPNLNTKEGVAKLNNILKGIPSILAEAKKVYKQRYWDPIQLDKLNSKELAHQIFDMAVNSGVPLAISLAYELVGLPKSTKYTTTLGDKLKAYGTTNI